VRRSASAIRSIALYGSAISNSSFRERFRMPALTTAATRTGAGVRKRPVKEHAGSRAPASSQLMGISAALAASVRRLVGANGRAQVPDKARLRHGWRRTGGEAMATSLQNRLEFCSFGQAAPLPVFKRRLKPAIDALESVLARIMTYRTPLPGIAFCAGGRPLRSAQ